MIILNKRRIYIIERLVANAPNSITVQQFAEALGCSERTIRHELDIVDDWFKQSVYINLIRKSNKGIYIFLKKDTREQVGIKLANLSIATYECDRDERTKVSSLLLLISKQPLTINKLESVFSISKGTVLKDLKIVEEFFNDFNITLKRKQRKGIWLEGEEFRQRQALTNLNKYLDTNLIQIIAKSADTEYKNKEIQLPESMLQMLDTMKVKQIEKIVDPILRLSEVDLSDEGRLTLYLHISMVLLRNESDRPVKMEHKASEFNSKKEYKVAQVLTRQIEKRFNTNLPEAEIAYIALHILGNQGAPSLQEIEDNEISKTLFNVIAQMTIHVEKLLEVNFNNKDKLNHGLYLHIQPAVYREKYGLVIENKFVDEIKEKYRRVYAAVKIAILPLEQMHRIVFSDNEIAYISMHYGGKLYQKLDDRKGNVSIVIVCNSGLGTANLLKNRIKMLFMNIRVINVLSKKTFLESTELGADLIISTVNLPVTSIPHLLVNPLLPEKDIKRLSKYLTIKDNSLPSAQQLYEAIWPIIKQHCDITSPKQLTDKMITTFNKLLNSTPIDFEPTRENVQVLEKEMIQLKVSVTAWREAIIKAVEPFFHHGIDTDSYSKEIISIIENQGPYMAVAPGIMLAHGSRKDIPRFALSFTRLEPPIMFGHSKNDPISFLFVFAASESNEHLSILQNLFDTLVDKENREALRVAKTASDVRKILKVIC